jgi:hypothetical protein
LLSVQSTLSACEREYKERYYTGRTDQRQALHALVEDVSESIGNPLAAIETIAFRGYPETTLGKTIYLLDS